jgi:hypothetical protein
VSDGARLRLVGNSPTERAAQRMAGIAAAQETRRLRREVKDLARTDPQEGARRLADLITDPPSWVSTWDVAYMVSLPRWLGPLRQRRMLAAAGLQDRHAVVVEELASEEAHRLAGLLREFADQGLAEAA